MSESLLSPEEIRALLGRGGEDGEGREEREAETAGTAAAPGEARGGGPAAARDSPRPPGEAGGGQVESATAARGPAGETEGGVAAHPATGEGEHQGAAGPVKVSRVQFSPLQPAGKEPPRNLALLLDVSLQVSVELGRTRMPIRDILELGRGSVLALDKLAGEPVDVLVNGRLVAKGEVVVVDDNFGVRITHIVDPSQRVEGLQ